jgi:hypothetical protein
MMLWAAAATTRKNREFLLAHGWGMLLCAPYVHQHRSAIGDWPMALDNGAWVSHAAGRPRLDVPVLLDALDTMRGRLAWHVLPDIVGGGMESWALTMEWLPRLADPEYGRPMAAVQDGMPWSVLDDLPPGVGLFVGGSTDWKVATLARWTELGHAQERPVHVGRVNSRRRMALCRSVGVDSIDGSGPTKWLKHAERVRRWADELRPQMSLWEMDHG